MKHVIRLIVVALLVSVLLISSSSLAEKSSFAENPVSGDGKYGGGVAYIGDDPAGQGDAPFFAENPVSGDGKYGGGVAYIGDDQSGQGDAPFFAENPVSGDGKYGEGVAYIGDDPAGQGGYLSFEGTLSAPVYKKNSIKIKTQPSDKTKQKVGNKVSFIASATGTGLKYQWYYKRATDSSLKKWGGKTSEKISYTIKANDDGMLVSCIIRDAAGNTKKTRTARIMLNKPETQKGQDKSALKVTYKGDSKSCRQGKSIMLTLQSKNEIVKQWRVKNEKGRWVKLGEKKPRIRVYYDDVKNQFPSWDGSKLKFVDFSCVTVSGKHYNAVVAFGTPQKGEEETIPYTIESIGPSAEETGVDDAISLKASGKAVITWVDESAKPVNGVYVTIMSADDSITKTVKTSKAGTAVFDLPANTNYYICCGLPDNYYYDGPVMNRRGSPIGSFKMKKGDTIEKTFTCKKYKTSTVTISVVDNNDKPVKNVAVTIGNATASFPKLLDPSKKIVEKTNKNGKATFKLKKGKYYVYGDGLPDGYQWDMPVINTMGSPIMVFTVDSNKESNYQLKCRKIKETEAPQGEKRTVTFTAMLKKGGKPLPDVKLKIVQQAFAARVITNSKGKASVKLPEGDYFVYVDNAPKGYCGINTQGQIFHVRDKDISETVYLAHAYNLRIRVVDNTNNVVPGAEVTLGCRTEKTNKKGIATFNDYLSSSEKVHAVVKITKKGQEYFAYNGYIFLNGLPGNTTTQTIRLMDRSEWYSCAYGKIMQFQVCKKPIIYLYSKTEKEVNVQLEKAENVTVSYPKYNPETGWNVTVHTDGMLTEKETGRNLYSLYWEGINEDKKIEDTGFVVAGADTAEFLEEKLKYMGLTDRETEEFIVYWLPVMQSNEYNYIRFETEEEINTTMPLTISPAADKVLRVWMDFTALEEKIEMPEQKLEKVNREEMDNLDFYAVEWGATEF